MATNYTYTQLQNIFLGLTANLRGINLAQDTQGLVRLAYQLNSAPFQEITDGVSYVWINYADSEENKQINEEWTTLTSGNLNINRTQLRKIDVHYTFYGNESVQDIAYMFRNKLFSYQAQSYLSEYQIKLIPEIPEGVLLFEQNNNQWWARVEIIASYYLESLLQESVPVYEVVDIDLNFEKSSLHRAVDGIEAPEEE